MTKLEVSIPLHKRLLRAEVSASDALGCLDQAADILERQIVKYKTRLRDRRHRQVATHDELTYIEQTPEESAPEVNITRSKRFRLKPMDSREAVMELELVNHDFFVFRNSATDEVNVVYKRKDGEYGLIEPE